MRAIVIVTFVALLGSWVGACCDCATVVAQKDEQVAELGKQIAELEAKVAELESARAAEPAARPEAAEPAAEAAPEDLASCIERLKACELDPFKGGKYFTPEKVDPRAAGKPAAKPGGGPADLMDPFKDKPKPEPKKGEVKDPFSKK